MIAFAESLGYTVMCESKTTRPVRKSIHPTSKTLRRHAPTEGRGEPTTPIETE